MRIILLGTAGGPTPKAARAAPGAAVMVGDALYVIDTGNGVARQLVAAGLPLRSLAGVFISHHHSDHNADFMTLPWLAWSGPLARQVQLFGPPPLAAMTRQFLKMQAVDIRTRMADEGRPDLARMVSAREITGPAVLIDTPALKVTAARVEHPPLTNSYAYRFDSPGRSVVFSGDTRPSKALAALARGADVLVHEAMYMPALERLLATETNATRLREHLLASHTTAEQAGEIAAAAGVGMLVLSHFVPGGDSSITDSQWAGAAARAYKGPIIVGRDLMEIPVTPPVTPPFTPES
ncbi:MBL fold metallo-hydrolase [Sandarakinorhabdus sp.]|uniref:MBL fold metallo-hydrolase n=1 Tax=Sandarakinorhabdus sp. TaxID=1916663 RepID=UPI00286E7560|nr:MBL fold metallo-hydrolase [Sandarakinorhabdus sp.]